jgi:hypothetical protein
MVVRRGHARIWRHGHFEHDEVARTLRLINQEPQFQRSDPDNVAFRFHDAPPFGKATLQKHM